MKTAVKSIVICFSGETLFVIEKVQLLLIRQRDLRMFAQKIMQRGRPRFLCARNNEIESFDLSWFGSEHRDDDQSRAAPYRAQSHSFELEKKLARYLVDFFVTLESAWLSRIVMGFALTKFAHAASALAEIIIVVTIIALLAATTIPALFVRENAGNPLR